MAVFVDPLQAVSEAIVTVLNAPSFAAICPGGVFDSIPQQWPNYPLLQYVVSVDRQMGGFGTKPGFGTLPEIRVRLHAYSLVTMKEAELVIAAAIELLKNPPAVSGYASWAIFWDTQTPLPNEMLIGVTVQEVVAQGRLYIEEGA